MPASGGAVRPIDWRLTPDGESPPTEAVPTAVHVPPVRRCSNVNVAASDPLPPWLRTVADSVKDSPEIGLLSLTVGVFTTRSGGSRTTTCTGTEQLLPVSLSPVTADTHARYS